MVKELLTILGVYRKYLSVAVGGVEAMFPIRVIINNKLKLINWNLKQQLLDIGFSLGGVFINDIN